MRRALALGGFTGVGKTTTGRALAARTGVAFVDTDQILAQRFGAIAAQFARDGEEVFRAREAALVGELASVGPAVIATGGGLWADPANRAALRRFAWLVVLEAPLTEIRRRVGPDDPGRPLWDDRVEARFHARQEAYRDADFTVSTDGIAVGDVARRIEAWWLARETGSG